MEMNARQTTSPIPLQNAYEQLAYFCDDRRATGRSKYIIVVTGDLCEKVQLLFVETDGINVGYHLKKYQRRYVWETNKQYLHY